MGLKVLILFPFFFGSVLAESNASAEAPYDVSTLAAPANDLEVRLGGASAELIAGEGISCRGDRVSPFRVTYSQLEINWKKNVVLENTAVVLAFRHAGFNGGEFTCEFTRDDLDVVLGTSGSMIPGGATVRNICGLQCGGVRLQNSKSRFVANGALTVLGQYYDPSRRARFDVQTSVPIKLIYNP
jgi:hypothetical protein